MRIKLLGDLTMLISDSELFKIYRIDENSTFKDLINNIRDYAYNEIKLDPIFNIDEWMIKLLKAETFLYITTKRHRDHLLHACRIAALGELLFKKEFTYRDEKFTFLDYVKTIFIKNENIKTIFLRHELDINNDLVVKEKILQAWYVASLFHDIGYIYDAFTQSWKNLDFLKEFPNFRQLDLDIEKSIENFQEQFIVSQLHEDNCRYDFNRSFDHGKIGACIISNLVRDSNPVCEIAALITDGHTSNEKIEFEKEPLPFLLALLDEIQEWQRPVMGRKITDQALSEKISMFSPYAEKSLRSPELDNINYSFFLSNYLNAQSFYWDDIPEKDEKKLKNFLAKTFCIDWAKTAIIERIEMGKTFQVSSKDNSLFITLNPEKSNAYIIIDDGRVYKCRVATEGEILKLYIISNQISFKLNFLLNFKTNAKFMDRNNFSLPMMLYLKYKNFQRLRTNNNTEYLNDDRFIGEKLSRFNLSLKVKIISDFPLAHLWDRQCNILFTKSSEFKNSVISLWLENIIKYRDRVGKICFDLADEKTPRAFDADFSKVILESNDIYLRDSYIKEKECSVEIEYKRKHNINPEHLMVSIKVRRTIANSSPDIPINGFYACFDEFVLDKLEIGSIKVNHNEIKDVFKQELPVEKNTKEEQTYRENYAVYIPFKSPLTEEEPKEIEYKYSYTTSLKNMKQYDGIFNGRGKNNMKLANLTVKWDKKLFESNYNGCILFNGDHKDMKELLSGLRKKMSYLSCKDNFKACAGDLKGNIVKNNFIEFKYGFKNINPYNMVGFAWLEK